MKIRDLLGNYPLNLPTNYVGKLLRYEEIYIDDFNIDERYQRDISPSYIKRGGALNLTLLTPIVVCLRPETLDEEERGYYVVDGQHRSLRVIKSDYEGVVPVVVMDHPKDATLEECVKVEASLFHKLNSLGKKPTKIDEVRAGIHSGDTKALHTLDVMEMLELTCDNFGSLSDTAREVATFTHFYIMCNQDYPHHSSKILAGYNLLNELYPKETVVKGDALRAMCLLDEFMKALSNGKQERFTRYVHNLLPKVKTIKALTKGRATSQSPTFILHDIIKMYNESHESENYRIGQTLIQKLSNPKLGGNSRFALPEDDS